MDEDLGWDNNYLVWSKQHQIVFDRLWQCRISSKLDIRNMEIMEIRNNVPGEILAGKQLLLFFLEGEGSWKCYREVWSCE